MDLSDDARVRMRIHASLEAAKAALKRNWLRWLEWSERAEVE
jgi:hypothetical protein